VGFFVCALFFGVFVGFVFCVGLWFGFCLVVVVVVACFFMLVVVDGGLTRDFKKKN
jgi:hypothetical protein